ncbi:prolyl oligopeptidase family serine peptidase [Larkinella rosea]|uniref:prolyl oligopeptidase n=1 Tax=Larkinella rosea TaxID=2025312 RepID=A0A3P1BU53_9BACT|nr:prolyl oligopeptidase family serine peptidase [Larkinella rosea]RRB04396.1 S9 family peptidase [Larkinella rosea]
MKRFWWFPAVLIALLASGNGRAQTKPVYPQTKTVDQTDNYHGVTVADPYRWLEDDRSPETAAWIKAQNELTYQQLNQIPFKDKIYSDLEKVNNYPRYSGPRQKGDYLYFYKNDGLQNQSVLYRQKGQSGKLEVVIDPNTLSEDGTVKLTVFSLSKTGAFAVLGFSKGGSDWQEYRVMDLKTRQLLSDKIEWVKLSNAAWQGDGFYYSRYPQPQGSMMAAKNENHQVFYHKVGTPQASDQLVFEDRANPQRFHNVFTTEDENYAILYIKDRGKGKDGNGWRIRKKGETGFTAVGNDLSDFKYNLVTNESDRFLIETNENAPNGKLVWYERATQRWKPFLDEKPEPLQAVGTAGGKVFASYSKDIATHVYVYNLKGQLENEVQLPVLGTATGFSGDKTDTRVFYTYTSLNYPPTLFQYQISTRKSAVFRKPEVSFNPEDYVVEQVFYPSRDGTKIPASIIYKKGLKRDGTNPTLMYAYGGFGVSWTPTFSPTRIAFLDQGGVYVQPNLRGGGEYGQKWHEQGMKGNKQNVFDDFIAAAEYLIAKKYTSPERLAIQGGSNGGLLLAAVMNQQPELFRVAFPSIGVLDMLRFHKFTVGWSWIPEFGCSDKAEDFRYLYAYSPLHNIKTGVAYPAVLVTTADHDDRVVPAHSFKYAATLQAKAGPSSPSPLLIRVDVNSGHGASSTKKSLETSAYLYAFLFQNMGLVWK